MAEFINREAFKKSVEERYCKPCKSEKKDHNGCLCRACWVDDMLDEVECFQPADVTPVRHGRWEEADWVEPDCHGFGTIRTPKAALRCSNCKNCFKKELLWEDNYCPNCGAKMNGGDNDAAD